MVAFSISYLLFRISCTIVFHTSSGILQKSKYLVMDYPNEIYELCANYIREQCAQATDRRLYKKVCKDLLQLIKWKGNATAKLLVDEFKATYPRRSALLDELQKVEKKL